MGKINEMYTEIVMGRKTLRFYLVSFAVLLFILFAENFLVYIQLTVEYKWLISIALSGVTWILYIPVFCGFLKYFDVRKEAKRRFAELYNRLSMEPSAVSYEDVRKYVPRSYDFIPKGEIQKVNAYIQPIGKIVFFEFYFKDGSMEKKGVDYEYFRAYV